MALQMHPLFAALALLVSGSTLAAPAVIFDMGGKFDKSFNESG